MLEFTAPTGAKSFRIDSTSVTQTVTSANGQPFDVSVQVPEGAQILGGGYSSANPNGTPGDVGNRLVGCAINGPTPDGGAWRVYGTAEYGFPMDLTVTVYYVIAD